MDTLDCLLLISKDTKEITVSSKANKLDSFCDQSNHDFKNLNKLNAHGIINILKEAAINTLDIEMEVDNDGWGQDEEMKVDPDDEIPNEHADEWEKAFL